MVKAGRCLAVFIFLFGFVVFARASQKVTPNTTLSIEKGNNTSAPDGFQAQSNGNAAAGNVSKVDIRKLLYPGATTSVFAHYMPWFGTTKHMNIGYSSVDPIQVTKQIDDMVSRGIQGVIIDWYGVNSAHADQSTTLLMGEAEKHPGFRFAVMEDAGAVRDLSDPTAGVISDLVYAWQKYEQSPAYLYINGRPVVFFFGLEKLSIDWNAIRAQVPGNPIFAFQNTGSFSDPMAEAGFSWVGSYGDPDNWGKDYLSYFYETGLKSNKQIVGSVKKGFNDTLAGWTKNRIINQHCGQTWLNTFTEIGNHFSSSRQLPWLQLVTWNDYEEGTAIEMGIDNCVTVNASSSGGKVTWTITGQENTIHHFSVFISPDGENLMKVGEAPASNREFNLDALAFDPGSYTVYIKAVGQPSIRNQISGPISYVVANPSAASDLKVSATPSVVTVVRGGSGSADVVLTPTGNFNRQVSLSCLNLPAGVTCTFDKASLTPGTQTSTVKLTLQAAPATTASLRRGAAFALWLPGVGFGMVVVRGCRISRKRASALFVALLLVSISLGCIGMVGPKPQQEQATKPGSYTFSIVAQADTFQRSVTATIALQ